MLNFCLNSIGKLVGPKSSVKIFVSVDFILFDLIYFRLELLDLPILADAHAFVVEIAASLAAEKRCFACLNIMGFA